MNDTVNTLVTSLVELINFSPILQGEIDDDLRINTDVSTILKDIIINFTETCDVSCQTENLSLDIESYVDWELSDKFQITNVDDSFYIKQFPEKWVEFITHGYLRWESLEYSVALQIIISLANLSLINKQKLATLNDLKSVLFNIIILNSSSNMSDDIQKLLQKLYSLMLSISCSPYDLFMLYSNFDNEHTSEVLNILAAEASDPLSQNYIQFENSYKIFKFNSNSTGKGAYTIVIHFQLNNVTSNRLMTIGRSLFFEIKERQLCVANDEYIIALFQDFEFKPFILYSLILTVDGTDVSMFVNGQFVNKISIFENPFSNLQILELGSMVSSLKLFRFQLFQGILNNISIKVLNSAGSMYKFGNNGSSDYMGIRLTFGDAFLEKTFKSTLADDLSFSSGLKLMNDLTYDKLLIDYDPYFDLIKVESDEFILPTNLRDDGAASNFIGNGKCYFYKNSNIVATFESFNSFRFILSQLENCDNMDQVYGFIKHLINLLHNNTLRIWFEKEYGYPLLGHILVKQVIEKQKKALPIQFLNLFLEYCGWDLTDITKSIIKDEILYENLILNFNLWYFDSQDKNDSLTSIEIIRFILFQISNLLEISIYQEYNSKKIKLLNVIQKLSNYQHYLAMNLFSQDIIPSLYHDLVNVYISLLREDLTNQNIHWLLNYLYYELKKSNYQYSSLFLLAIDSVFREKILNDDTMYIQLFCGSISVKFLLMTLDEIIINRGSPVTCLSMLLKILMVNTIAYDRFCTNAGFDLLMDILERPGVSDYEEIVCLLFKFSLGNLDYECTQPYCEEFLLESISPDTKINFKTPLCLAVNFLEWAVINDIRSGFQIDLNIFISNFIEKLTVLSISNKNIGIFDTRQSKILKNLLELYITLSKPQNGKIYEKSYVLIANCIANQAYQNTMTLNSNEFEKYLDALMQHDSKSNCTFVVFVDPCNSYLQYTFVESILLIILDNLLDVNRHLSLKLLSCPYMMSNILALLNLHKSKYSYVEFTARNYVTAIAVLLKFIRIFETSDSKSIKNVSRPNLLNITVFFIVRIQYLLYLKKLECDPEYSALYFETVIRHKDLLFESNNCHFEKDFIFFTFLFLLSELNHSPNNIMVVKCIRSILLDNIKSQKHILDMMDVKARIAVHSIISSLLTLGNDEVILTIKRLSKNIINEGQDTSMKKFADWKLEYNGSYVGQNPIDIRKRVFHLKQSRMDADYRATEKIHSLFGSDNINLNSTLMKYCHKQFSNFVTDIEEEHTIHANSYKIILSENLKIIALHSEGTFLFEWYLDSVNDYELSRRKLLSAPLKSSDFTENNEKNNDYKTITNDTKIDERRGSSSLISYTIINDIELEKSNSENSDENRKVLKILKHHDSIKKIWNCSRVIGLEIKEGILILGNFNLYFIDNYYFLHDQNKVVILSEIVADLRDPNISLISSNRIESGNKLGSHEVFNWELSKLTHITKRPFLLRDVAVEILFSDGINCFFSFNNKVLRDRVYTHLDKLKTLSNLDPVLECALTEINKRSIEIGLRNGISKPTFKMKMFNVLSTLSNFSEFDATKQWVNGEISNFYYLMILNTLAGRTLNDLTQYPVFPWIIADQTSDKLDLNDTTIFRDLSKPMGAQSSKRAKQFKERYESLEALDDPSAPPFHYGTHYSSAMIISSYLIRLKPFVDSFLLLQDGKFGHADRIFNSIGRAWASAGEENTTDIRELIPEFFFLPEFLINMNKFEFGKDQKGKIVNDVQLPRWASNDPTVYIWKNRQALESEYVSDHLHEWIDLIFGSKQKGENAIKSLNVFNNLSYPGAVNLDNIDDQNERRAITGIIHNFGQTPLQIFSEPHPKREIKKCFSIKESVIQLTEYPNSSRLSKSDLHPIEYIRYDKNSKNETKWEGFALYQIILDNGLKDIMFNNSTGISLSIEGNIQQILHNTIVTAIGYEGDSSLLTGDNKGLIKLWKTNGNDLIQLGSLHGHLFEIKEMCVYSEYNILISLDISGSVFSWDLTNYQAIRKLGNNGTIITISQNQGNICILTKDNDLKVYNLNGILYCQKAFNDKIITAMDFFNCSSMKFGNLRHAYWVEKEVLAIGYLNGQIDLFELLLSDNATWDLRLISVLNTNAENPITCIKLHIKSKFNEQDMNKKNYVEIMAGDSKGKLYFWT